MQTLAVLPPPSADSADAIESPTQEVSCVPPLKKVLLLEDDPNFKDIMETFLQESGYEVIAVHNGVEGVHQVQANDFEVILCDMMMPTLPGDMFFRAVERMRPHLCDRFIFMTGHSGNPKVNDFISTVRGSVLTKPFQVDDLLEMIAFIQVRSAVRTAA
ncbi:MAG: response regulator [Chthoniobacteraceae bacterium]